MQLFLLLFGGHNSLNNELERTKCPRFLPLLNRFKDKGKLGLQRPCALCCTESVYSLLKYKDVSSER